MNAETCELIKRMVLQGLGIRVDAIVSAGDLIITPSDYHRNEAFAVWFNPGWRSAEVHLLPGKFAGAMVRSIGEAPDAAKAFFCGYAESLRKIGAEVTMKINGAGVDAFSYSEWPHQWNSFEAAIRKTALVFDLNKDDELLPIVEMLVIPLIGMAMALIGTENVETEEGEVEGALIQNNSSKYERKKINRDACIRIHGTKCMACGFDFGVVYGEIAEGFIEVHHNFPLSLTGEVRINPVTDLSCLCSNCHSVVHRLSPPIPVNELRDIITKRSPR